MSDGTKGRLEDEGPMALALMEQALELLDRCDTGLEAGAHLDLAICRLRARLQSSSAATADTDITGQELGPDILPWSKAS
jgi:hypothetical protein